MSDTTLNQNQGVAAKDAEQSTAETVPANDASTTEHNTDPTAAQDKGQQQTGTGPKALLSHYRGMPRQWEKNLQPKKDGE
ncbi:hypothetical protein SAMD00023353_7000510 [Rosellinia necatrix]|uniref:Uncharacterized protein n=1 Tax=Rosellinia necatrix TaxID=77044 RepID=A0A1W2TK15_ROSNE|nr:hypothetical protein SAMD00023353_7000510 [Rosellinia necatrix]